MNLKELKTFLKTIILNNKKLQEVGESPAAVNVLGLHGIGKSSIQKELGQELGMHVAVVKLAEIEPEDLVGNPITEYLGKDGKWYTKETLPNNPELLTDTHRTTYAKPDWYSPLPTLLILDDATRAPKRMMQACMDITLNQSYMSWNLPKGSTVLLNGNPAEDINYDVTDLDSAQSDRFIKVEAEFDKQVWAEYALNRGLDSRGVNFIMLYPEVVTNFQNETLTMLNSPRAFTLLFNQLRFIKDYREKLTFITQIANGLLNKEAVNLFLQFITSNLDTLPEVHNVLEEGFDKELKKVIKPNTQEYRSDISSLLSFRLAHYLIREFKLNKLSSEDILKLSNFIVKCCLSEDNKFYIVTRLTECPDLLAEMLENEELSKYLTT